MAALKSYKKRWYILLVFVYYTFINTIQMTAYSSITEIVARYYNVSHFSVNWTSLIYMVLYPVLVVPASYIIEKKGLRAACLFGCLGTAVGTGIKVFSIERDCFWVVILGQTFTASAIVFIMCLPPKIASVWFRSNEASMACSLGSLGANLGNAFGYLLAVSVVPDSKDPADIKGGLKFLSWILSALMIPVSLAVTFYFPAKPSESQQTQHDNAGPISNFSWKSIKWSRAFLLHTSAYAINIGVFSTLIILLSELVNAHFESAAEDAGRMGFCLLVFGVIGCVGFGFYLDKTHRYKESCIFLFASAITCIIALTVALQQSSLIASYIFCSILGIVINPYIPVGFEFGIELTYPSDEGTVAGFLFATSQITSSVFGICVAQINSYAGSLATLGTLAALMVVGTVIQALVPNKLKRQKSRLVGC
ncbi:uncharacterized MFS-type transporter C09D4.1-like [Euwallacea fornicatus]|uniref:uncharacterized MFS-type transporter C09D4.1-like n=1 Tax=Euwallacea fornicatus TaxID=995702 RepID=UPI00338E93E7